MEYDKLTNYIILYYARMTVLLRLRSLSISNREKKKEKKRQLWDVVKNWSFIRSLLSSVGI